MDNNKENKKIMYLTLSIVFFVLTIIFLALTLTSVPENRLSINGIKTNKISTLYLIILVISILLGGYFLYKFIDESKKNKK